MNDGPPKKQLTHWQYLRKCPQFGRGIDRFVTEAFTCTSAENWLGADEIEGLGVAASAEAETEKADKRLVLAILRRARVIKVWTGPRQLGSLWTQHDWYALSSFGRILTRCPGPVRRSFYAAATLSRRIGGFGRLIRQLSSVASFVVAVFKWWQGHWSDLVLAVAVFVAIISTFTRPDILDT